VVLLNIFADFALDGGECANRQEPTAAGGLVKEEATEVEEGATEVEEDAMEVEEDEEFGCS